jgi:hypothetical protein
VLKPEELRSENQATGTFVAVRNMDGREHKVTPVEAGTTTGWGCTRCSFYGTDDCTNVHCWKTIWIGPDSFPEYLEKKLLK